MSRLRRIGRAFSLLEIVLVIGLLSILSALAVPNLLRQLTDEKLPGSARELRSLLSMTRAKTMLDGKRHRIRFPRSDEIDARGGTRQPIIERENEPFEDPGVFETPWIQNMTWDLAPQEELIEYVCENNKWGTPLN